MKTIVQRVFDEIHHSPAGINELARRLRLGRPKVKSACDYLRDQGKIQFIFGKHTAPGRPSTSRYEIARKNAVRRSWLQHIHPSGDGFEVFGKHFTARLPAHRYAYTVTHEVTPCHS